MEVSAIENRIEPPAIPKIGKYTPRRFQWDAHLTTESYIREEFKAYKETGADPRPAILNVTVGGGKSLLIGAMADKICNKTGWKCLVLARQGELVDQDSECAWEMEVKNSIYSASLNRKSTHFNCVVGTSGTVVNDLEKSFSEDFIPDIILIDECHQVDWKDFLNGGHTEYARIINHFKKLNKRLAIIGYTGSPYRGVESILGDFWHKEIYTISTEELVEMGFLVPTVFGWPHDDIQYHMEEFSDFSGLGASDFSSEELAKMSKIATKDATLTQKIILDVIELTKDRGGVLITCASKRHCEQAAEFLPEGSWAIVTDETGNKKRKEALKKAKSGEIKYTLQIGCLTTGVNVPLWSTSVLLRRIGSLTLLVQLLGRGMRLLTPEQIESGLTKTDHLVLDYSGTMDAMGALYSDPILDRAKLDKDKKEEKDLIECPKCGMLNSATARRCCGEDEKVKAENKIRAQNGDRLLDTRCDFFWSSKPCPHCGTENDTAAQVCRNHDCRKELIDPNEKLARTHYKSTDWKKCTGMEMIPTKNNGVLVKYKFDGESGPESADLFYSPFASDVAKRVWQQQFVYRHIQDWSFRSRAMTMKSAVDICNMKAMFTVPEEITHRINEKGKHLIHGMKFSNRTLMGSKEVKNDEA